MPKAFKINIIKNIKIIILIITNTFGKGINNLNIQFVIQWDLSINFALIIQHISQIERKN